MNRFMISMALASFIVFGCGAEPEVASADSPPAAESSAVPAAGTRGESAEEYLPELADDGTLPRTLRGYTLLDPAPAESTEKATFPFKGSLYRSDVLRTKPRASAAVYSLDETIFRIGYFDDAPPPWDDLVRVGLERYGKPFQQKDNEIIWIRGGRTMTMSYYPKSGKASLAIEDEKGTMKAFLHAQELERSE